jgi:dihydrofolate reductase
MKVILYMSTTVNGYIARENDDTDFVSDTEWESFVNMVKKVDNIIIGRRTYEIMQKSDDFARLSESKIVVVTSNVLKSENPNVFFANTPEDALKLLQDKGFSEALVAGGGKLNSSFMKENLIDEVYLDVEPIVLGKGIKLFADDDFETNLELIEVNKLSPNEVQLHYRVIK